MNANWVIAFLKLCFFVAALFLSSWLSREYLQELSIQSTITPFRVTVLAILFGATVLSAGSIDLGAISFVTCLLISVYLVYPAYVRDAHIKQPSEMGTYLWAVLILFVVLIAGLSTFAAPSMVSGLSGMTGILISYVAIGLSSTLFGHFAIPLLVDESSLLTNDGEDESQNDDDEHGQTTLKEYS